MKKYKYLISSVVLIILMVLIFKPRKPEVFYIIYDKNESFCNQKIIEQNLTKDSYIICEDSKFINFIENPEEKSETMNLKTLKDFKIISTNKLLERFNNNSINNSKHNFDLLNRKKKFEFNLIIINKDLDNFKLIPVKQVIVLSQQTLIDELYEYQFKKDKI